MKKIKIEFFHDVICSFCFPMSYRMRQLKEEMPDVEIIHRSFALVKSEMDFVRMFGSREKAKNEILTHWQHANENDDLHRFNIPGMRKENFLFPMSTNPLRACKAAFYVAGDEGYWDLFDVLQEALFIKNRNIELEEIIFELVTAVGLDLTTWKEYYKSDEIKAAVESDLELASKYGLHGVPALIINGSSMVNGAASLEQIKKAVETEQYKTDSVVEAGGACDITGCKI